MPRPRLAQASGAPISGDTSCQVHMQHYKAAGIHWCRVPKPISVRSGCMGQVRLPSSPCPSLTVVTVDHGQLLTSSPPSWPFAPCSSAQTGGQQDSLFTRPFTTSGPAQSSQLLAPLLLKWVTLRRRPSSSSTTRGPTPCYQSAARDTALTSSTPFSPS